MSGGLRRAMTQRYRSVTVLAMLACALATACSIRDGLVPCGELSCPHGSVCNAGACVSPEQVAACVDRAAGETCSTRLISEGVCVDGVCQPMVCGDGKVVGAEVCDDGNQHSTDGCSADCASTE